MAGYHFDISGEKPPPYMYPFVFGHRPFAVQPHSLHNQFTWQQPFPGTCSAYVLSDACIMMSTCSVSGCPGDAQKTGNVKDVDDSVWEYLETQAACLGQSLWEKNELKVKTEKPPLRSPSSINVFIPAPHRWSMLIWTSSWPRVALHPVSTVPRLMARRRHRLPTYLFTRHQARSGINFNDCHPLPLALHALTWPS